MTFAVKVENGIVTDTAPIARRFIGKPAKKLGDWVRTFGPVQVTSLAHFDYQYIWGNNDKRLTLKGRPCRVVARGTRRSVLVEFENGQREIVSIRALRKGEQ